MSKGSVCECARSGAAWVEKLECRRMMASAMQAIATIGPEPESLVATTQGHLFLKNYESEMFHHNGVAGSPATKLPGSIPGFGELIVDAGGGTVYYALHQLWATDGTVQGSTMIFDGQPRLITPFKGGVLFVAVESSFDGAELWFADGGGVRQIKDINPGGSSDPGGREFRDDSGIVVVGNFAYFSANDGTHGAELWKTDGTAAGTVMVKDTNAGTANGSPRSITKLGNRIVFTAEDAQQDEEVWVSDGTAKGTTRIKEFNAPYRGAEPYVFGSAGAYAYFVADVDTAL